MKIDPRHLEVIAAVVDQNGVTEGAAALGKSQPSISRTITQLEQRIGAPLFKPGRRPLQPTELGLLLAEQGRAVQKANQRASETLTRFRAGRSGLVRVGGTPIFMDGVISGMIARFQQQMPDVHVDQSYGFADTLSDRIRNDLLDIAVLPLEQKMRPVDLSFHPVLQGQNVIACRIGHPLARRKLVTPKDIARYPWIAPPADSPLYKDLQLALSRIGVDDFRISFSGGSLASVIAVLSDSDSQTVLPYSVVFLMKSQGQIAALSLDIGHPNRELGLLAGPALENNPAAKRFRSFVIAQFGSLSRRITQFQKDQLWR